jgi:nitrate reductase NapE component
MVNRRDPAKTAGKQQNNVKRTTLRKVLTFLFLNATLLPVIWILVDAILGGAM